MNLYIDILAPRSTPKALPVEGQRFCFIVDVLPTHCQQNRSESLPDLALALLVSPRPAFARD